MLMDKGQIFWFNFSPILMIPSEISTLGGSHVLISTLDKIGVASY